MDSMKYVELAKDDSSYGRANLSAVYREKDRLVATDGHRLHYVGGLPSVEKGHFLDGRDAEFPNYETVFIKEPVSVGTIEITKKAIRDLTALSKVVRERNCATRIVVSPGEAVRFECTYKNETGGGSWVYTTGAAVEITQSWDRLVNLRYFLDAVVAGFETEIVSGPDRSHPIEFKTVVYGQPFHAIVMPVREEA
jgi:hypothetical protein